MSSDNIHIKVTMYHKILDALSALLIVGMIGYLAVVWKKIPDTIPTHYNFAGEIDGWGGKGTLIILPVVTVFLYLGITAAQSFPELWNTGVKVTEENKDRVYREMKNMIVTAKFAAVLGFTYITVHAPTLKPLPGWFITAFMLGVFGPVAFFMIRIVKRRGA